jgi:transcriptional regulator with XRE-family HTH domain
MPYRHQTRVGEALHDDLRRANLTQEDLGQKLGVTQQAISEWIRSNKLPRKRLPAIAEVLGPTAEVLKAAAEADVARDPLFYNLHKVEEQGSNAEEILRGRGVEEAEPGFPVKSREEPEVPNLRQHTIGWSLGNALPEDLRANMSVRSMLAGGKADSRRSDYASRNLVLEMKSCSTPYGLRNVVYAGAIRVLLSRALSSEEDARRRRHVVAVVMPPAVLEDLRLSSIQQRLSADLDLLGIGLLYAGSVQQVADYIVSMERRRAGSPDNWGPEDEES